jgi:hypothetical protein
MVAAVNSCRRFSFLPAHLQHKSRIREANIAKTPSVNASRIVAVAFSLMDANIVSCQFRSFQYIVAARPLIADMRKKEQHSKPHNMNHNLRTTLLRFSDISLTNCDKFEKAFSNHKDSGDHKIRCGNEVGRHGCYS